MSKARAWGYELEVRGRELIITLPGTSYRAIYHKPQNSPQLLAKIFPRENEKRALVGQAEFLARAWKLANNKARELGWIA
ncbi:MAG: hypothetical protein WA884_10975 [Methyloceanibacter sp.]